MLPVTRPKKALRLILVVLPLMGLGFLLFRGPLAKDDRLEVGRISPSTLPSTAEVAPPSIALIPNEYHIYQSFNNCAPAALSMALSYFGINVSQEKLAAELRPYNNPQGEKDDKSTPPQELAGKAMEYGLLAYFRPNGTTSLLERLVANGIPVIVRSRLYPDQDYAHYRIIKGYDRLEREIIQDDSLEGKNQRFTYQEWQNLWQPFNYAYLVLARPEQKTLVESILGEDVNAEVAWQKAAERAREEMRADPADYVPAFNLAVALYYLGEHQAAAKTFAVVEKKLPLRTLWYQVEPLENYFALHDYHNVLRLTEEILVRNPAFAELYLLRGKSFVALRRRDEAQAEFEQAIFYNNKSLAIQQAVKEAGF